MKPPLKNLSHLMRGKWTLKSPPPHKLSVEILPQPDDTTCGPTCLHAIYRYYGDQIELDDLIKEVPSFDTGGTIAAWLGCHALKRGYKAIMYTFDLQFFDPTWFQHDNEFIINKLKKQLLSKKGHKLEKVTEAYTEFLQLGGVLKLEDLTRDLLRYFLTKNIPIITGLNSNFLYRSERVVQETMKEDDVKGETTGHFVVLRGYRRENKTIYLADPFNQNPYASQKYKMPIDRVINAILLGILTFDANFLVIHPYGEKV